MDGITASMDMSLSKLREIVEDRKPGVLQSRGRKELDTTATELNCAGIKKHGFRELGPDADFATHWL